MAVEREPDQLDRGEGSTYREGEATTVAESGFDEKA